MGFCDVCAKYRELRYFRIWIAAAMKSLLTARCNDCARSLDEKTKSTRYAGF